MLVRIIMGSSSDAPIGKKVCDYLEKFQVPYEVSVVSAHRSLDDLVKLIKKDDADLYIGLAGKAAHLSGVIAGMTIKPVIGVPIKSSSLDGMDALLSTVQMPSGVPVATVAINGGENAAVLATQILALKDGGLAKELEAYKLEMKENVRKMNDEDEIQELQRR